MREVCPICREKLVNNRCPLCGYVNRKNTWSQRTTACEECLTPQIDLDHTAPREADHSPEQMHHTAPKAKGTLRISAGARTGRFSRQLLLILAICSGWLGLHRFLTGHWKLGILYFFTYGLFGVGWLVDVILIATGNFKDKSGMIIL